MSNQRLRRCTAKNCNASDNDIKLFRFPHGINARDRYDKWAIAAGKPELIGKNMHLYLCAKHFSSNQFRDREQTKLIYGAVPNVEGLEDFPDTSTSCSILPERENSMAENNDAENLVSHEGGCNQFDSHCNYLKCLNLDLEASGNYTDFAKKIKCRPLLQVLNVTRKNELTPKKQILLQYAAKKERALKRMKRKWKTSCRNIFDLNDLNVDPVKELKHLVKKVNVATAIFIAAQMRLSIKKPKGRRWTKKEKIIALSLFKRSPKCYTLLRSIFALPSRRTLLRLLGRIPCKPGINIQVMELLKKKVIKMDQKDCKCILLFDEMSLRRHVQYNSAKDLIMGVEDDGKRRTNKYATQAVVFMAKGLRRKWKQPVAFYFSSSATSAEKLVTYIKDVVEALETVQLIVLGTVCDMGTNNVKALQLLGSTVSTPYFIMNNRKIFTIYDPPHLLKCTRNMLYKHSVLMRIKHGEETTMGEARWDDIREVFCQDSELPVYRLLHKLTDSHIDPSGFSTMKVSLAAQLLSHTVAAAITTYVASGRLHAKALATAQFVGFMNELFDSVNGSSSTQHGARGLRCELKIRREKLHLDFWKEAISKINGWKFIKSTKTKNCPPQHPGKPKQNFFRPPSQDGWIVSLRAIQQLWIVLKDEGFSYLKLRSVNQDNLEQLFGAIRAHCGSNYNPTVQQFIGAFKTCIVNGLVSSDRKYENCEEEEDPASVLSTLEEFMEPSFSPSQENGACLSEQATGSTVTTREDNNVAELEKGNMKMWSVAYVCGYVARKLLAKNTCEKCKSILLAEDTSDLVYTGISFKEYSENGCSLVYPSVQVIETVNAISELTELAIPTFLPVNDIRKHLIEYITDNLTFEWIKNGCESHSENVSKNLLTYVINLSLFWWCKRMNRYFISDSKAKRQARKCKILSNQ